nr:hypothetical protein [Tanacetum cinerariifolium]
MLYTRQEIFFRLHQGPGINDHARTFSSLLLVVVDKRNLNPLKLMRVIEQLRARSRITNCDVLTRKGPITLTVYRYDGTDEVIHNFKASDLHLVASPFLPSPPKSSSQPEGELIKKDKGKVAMSSKDAKEKSTESDFDDDTINLDGSMVESSKKKKMKKFDFITKGGEHAHFIEEQIKEQKRIEESVKANASKQEVEARKEDWIDLLGVDVVTKYYKAKWWYDGTDEVIHNFKASDLHLGEWIKVEKACPNRTRKGWSSIYEQIQERMDYLHKTEAELRIDLDKPIGE